MKLGTMTLAALALTLAAVGLALVAPPAAQAARAEQLATGLIANDAVLRHAVADWRDVAGEPPAGQAPDAVSEPAGYLQRKVRFLAAHPTFAKRVTLRLPGRLRGEVQALTAAARKLRRLSAGAKRRRLKSGKPQPLSRLVAHYEKAERRHRIGAHYLAAINLVETKFGRVKSNSTAGAKGPMQFIPSTWRIYGRGGNIRDPHDAVLAAARLLRDRGAPRRYGRALYAYNPSRLYVGAVSIYAKLIAREREAIYYLYTWGP